MTPDEKEIMTLTIKSAMLEGFQEFAKTMNTTIDDKVRSHKSDCIFKSQGTAKTLSVSLAQSLSDWKTIVGIIFSLAWVLSTVVSAMSGTGKITNEQLNQIVQDVKHVITSDSK